MEKIIHKRGNIYRYYNDFYMLATLDNSGVCLVKIYNQDEFFGLGNRWREPINVKYIENITDNEFKLIAGELEFDKFKYVGTDIFQAMKNLVIDRL